MTKIQKILVVVGGALGTLWLMSRSSSAAALSGGGVTGSGGEDTGSRATGSTRMPPNGPPFHSTYFGHDQSEIPSFGRVTLSHVLDVAQREGFLPNRWELHGYASSEGSEAYNVALTERRMTQVALTLQTRYPDVPVDTYAHGESNPKAPNTTEEGRVQNRRVDTYAL